MTANRRPAARRLPLLAILGLLALAVAACGSSAGSAGSPAPLQSDTPGASLPVGPTPTPFIPTAVPGGPTQGPVSPPSFGSDPGKPGPTFVTPVANLLSVRAVGAVELAATVDGHHVTVRVAWWSGVEPCSVLAGVDVVRDGSAITLTVREGAARLDVACIEIAVYKATIVDLGELDPGTWTISAFGEAKPIEVVVTG